jgi:hypothetical protein
MQMKNIGLLLAVALAACHGHGAGERHGAIFTGPQPTAITLTSGTNHDVSLTANNGSPGAIIRLTPNSAGSTLTGLALAAAQDGDMFILRNEGSTASITITSGDTTSAAGNRFLLSGSQSVVLPPYSAVMVEYDATNAAWEMGPGHINSPTFQGSVTVVGSTTTTQSSGVETVTSGALSQTKKTILSITGTQAYTLADCTASQLGLKKTVEVGTTAASTPVGTLTLTTTYNSEPTTHVFTTTGQYLTFECEGTSGWHVIDKHRAGTVSVVVGTTVLTGYDVQSVYALSVTGTVSSTSTKAIPACYFPTERIHVLTTTAASTPVGTIAVLPGTTIATGVAASTGLAGINATTAQADFVCDGANWQNTALTTATYSMLDELASWVANAA